MRRTRTRLRVGPIVLAVLLVLGLAALVARDTIERLALAHELASRVGDASIAGLRHTASGRILTDVRLRTRDGGATIAIDRLELAERAGRVEADVRGLRAQLILDRLGGDESERVAALASALGGGPLQVTVTGGAAAIARTEGAPALALAGLTGRLHADGPAGGYELRGRLLDGSATFPVSGHGSFDGARLAQRWTAERLPLAPLAALLPSGDLAVRGGEASDVSVRLGPELRASLTLADASGALGTHEFRALAGPLVVTSDGIGTAGLRGTVDDGVSLQIAGEVHDGAGWRHAALAGIKDLQPLRRLFDRIAVQPELKWMRFEATAPGIAYGQFAMATKGVPHVVQLLAVDPNEPTLRFDTALADDRIISGGARTSQLGARTGAVAGVNGDYFDIGRTYEPQGMLVRGGTLLHGPTDHWALAIDRHNNATFAVFHLHGQVVDGDRSYRISQVNSWPARYVSVITPDYGKTLRPAPGMSFAALEPLGGSRYRIAAVQPVDRTIPVRFGLGFGSSIHEPLPRPGDVVDVSYGIDPPVDGLVCAISSGPLLLKDGVWFEDARAPAPDERDVQWPVVALGTVPGEGLLLAAVDGRHPERSIGMTRPEFAALLTRFGVRDAMALDSGGSVTMVARTPGDADVSLHNVPSDDSAERYISDALFVYSSAPRATIVTKPIAPAKPS